MEAQHMNEVRDLFFSQQALSALFAVTNKLQLQGDKYLRDLTIRQMLAIPAIIHAPDGKATINYVARKLGTTKQSAKQIMEALEKKKYISIAPSERDKRAVDVTITPEGGRAFTACSERTDEFLADIFHDFSTKDLETFCALLARLYRFDGSRQDILESMNHQPGDADIIRRHHPNYIKRRTANHE
jgi:DNA-binding MarR family transcriptional regulator